MICFRQHYSLNHFDDGSIGLVIKRCLFFYKYSWQGCNWISMIPQLHSSCVAIPVQLRNNYRYLSVQLPLPFGTIASTLRYNCQYLSVKDEFSCGIRGFYNNFGRFSYRCRSNLRFLFVLIFEKFSEWICKIRQTFSKNGSSYSFSTTPPRGCNFTCTVASRWRESVCWVPLRRSVAV